MENLFLEIRKTLKDKADTNVKKSVQKFVPTQKKIYGVKVPILNRLANEFKSGGFQLIESLWKSGFYEEKLLAIKILGKICENEPEKSLNFIKKFSKGISDWAVCDTLASQSVRKIIKTKQKEILKLSEELASSKNLWQRRFALVLLINYKNDRKLRKQIKRILEKVKDEKEYYVKKAVIWLKKEIKL